MKFLYRALLCSCLALMAVMATPQSAKACDQSSFLLDSVSFDGVNYTVYATLCIGGGTLGGASGANAFTADFAIAAYGGSGTIIGFNPPGLISDSVGCPLTGGLFPVPPVPSSLSGTPDPATAYVVYQSTTSCPYTCISNTVVCGLPHNDCNAIELILSDFPDSLTAIGIEGQGNPANGCHRNFAPGYDDNITIDFTITPVTWGGFEAVSQEDAVDLNWITMNEANNDYFEVMRSADARSWEQISTVAAVGNSDDATSYNFTDYSPLAGVNHYRIRQIDKDAKFTQTEVRTVHFDGTVAMDWLEVGPIPTRNQLFASFIVPEAEIMEIEVFGMDGRMVHKESIDAQAGANSFQVDMADYENGIYFVRLKGTQGTLERKTIKI